RTNRDRALPRARVTTPGAAPQTTSRPLTPVSKAALPTANQQATAILNSTQTLLLRSAQTEASKVAHYQQVAEAIGSNKVLLRST
ncbi:MAG: hypothetical protein AB8B51_18055, partial [Sedimentitalea sp.]